MNDDLFIVTSLDQSTPIDDSWILNEVQVAIERSVTERNVNIILNVCKQLVAIAKLSGIALAKTLYSIKQNWNNYDIEDDFEDIIYPVIGLHPHTIDRYIAVWSMYAENQIPEQFVNDVRQKNIKDQVPIANALQQGYEIDTEDWEKLVSAPDYNTVSKIIREDVTCRPPRKTGIQIYIHGDGTIVAYKDDEAYNLGFLDVSDEREPVQSAINRIVKNSGIMRI